MAATSSGAPKMPFSMIVIISMKYGTPKLSCRSGPGIQCPKTVKPRSTITSVVSPQPTERRQSSITSASSVKPTITSALVGCENPRLQFRNRSLRTM